MKKTSEQLQRDLQQMYENNRRSNKAVTSQIKKALSGDDFQLAGKTINSLSDLSNKEIDELVSVLHKMLKSASSEEEKELIKKLIQELLKLKSSDKEDDNKDDGNNDDDKPKDDEPHHDYDDRDQKGRDYGEYAQIRLSGQRPRNQRPTVDTSQFDNLSKKELLSYFVGDKFYSLSENQRLALCQCVANHYLAQNGVEPCAVVFDDLEVAQHSVVMGCYRPNKGAIYINRHLVMADGTPQAPLQVLATLVHEAQHCVQFDSFDDVPTTAAERAIQRSLTHGQSGMSHGRYLAEADELDARNASLVFMREMALAFDDERVTDFYNIMKYNELHNGKDSVGSVMQEHCSEIFSENYIGSINNISQRAKQSTRQLFDGVYHSYCANSGYQRSKR